MPGRWVDISIMVDAETTQESVDKARDLLVEGNENVVLLSSVGNKLSLMEKKKP